jgi:hypothetical protein
LTVYSTWQPTGKAGYVSITQLFIITSIILLHNLFQKPLLSFSFPVYLTGYPVADRQETSLLLKQQQENGMIW